DRAHPAPAGSAHTAATPGGAGRRYGPAGSGGTRIPDPRRMPDGGNPGPVGPRKGWPAHPLGGSEARCSITHSLICHGHTLFPWAIDCNMTSRTVKTLSHRSVHGVVSCVWCLVLGDFIQQVVEVGLQPLLHAVQLRQQAAEADLARRGAVALLVAIG